MRTFALITLILASVIKANTVIKHFHYHFEGGSNPMPMRFLEGDEILNRAIDHYRKIKNYYESLPEDEQGFYKYAAYLIRKYRDADKAYDYLFFMLNDGNNKWGYKCADAQERLNRIEGIEIDRGCSE